MTAGALGDGAARSRAASLLAEFIAGHAPVALLTGAGCSTESGIPDYRSPGGAWSRHKPVQYGEFVRSDAARRRYWARSYAGWERFSSARPNPAHEALRDLESLGLAGTLITQNVDGLHQAAGSRDVVELHGSNHRVACLSCATVVAREQVQERIRAENPGWSAGGAAFAPDGDAALGDEAVQRFAMPGCARCGGILKPDVVFFGENVPMDRVKRSFEALDASRAFLVVGSSLTVFSGYRFVLGARDRGMPVAILNVGETRGDAIAGLKIEARCGELLPEAVALLAGGD